LIPELNIVKLTTGIYEAHIQVDSVAIAEPSIHNSIAEAIAEIGNDIPENIATYLVIYFAGVTIGTTSIDRMKKEPERIAEELVNLTKEVEFDRHQRVRALNA
jgi:hypothetical protein